MSVSAHCFRSTRAAAGCGLWRHRTWPILRATQRQAARGRAGILADRMPGGDRATNRITARVMRRCPFRPTPALRHKSLCLLGAAFGASSVVGEASAATARGGPRAASPACAGSALAGEPPEARFPSAGAPCRNRHRVPAFTLSPIAVTSAAEHPPRRPLRSRQVACQPSLHAVCGSLANAVPAFAGSRFPLRSSRPEGSGGLEKRSVSDTVPVMEPSEIERYIELRNQLAAIEAELEDLKPRIAEHVHQLGDKLRFGDYQFRAMVNRSWTYSSEVEELQKQLTEKRREEVAQGIAQIKKETRFVMMASLKQPLEPPHDSQTDDDIPY